MLYLLGFDLLTGVFVLSPLALIAGMLAVADPLHRFPIFRTSNAEKLRQFGSTLFGAARINLKNIDNFEARVNLVRLYETGLAFGATSRANS